MTDDSKIKYKIFYNKEIETMNIREDITLSVEGQTDTDTLNLFKKLKKEVGFVAPDEV